MRSKQNTSVKRAAQTAPVIALRFLGLLGFSLIAVLWLAKSTFAADKIIASHGISSFGELKYPADMAHFDYVNPQTAYTKALIAAAFQMTAKPAA